MHLGIWLDAAAGQPWSGRSTLSAASELAWSLPMGVHSPAANTRALVSASLSDLAASWQLSPQQILPVHGLSNAFRIALSDGQDASVSATARFGMRQFAARTIEVDPLGQLLALPTAGTVAFEIVNPESGALQSLAELRAKSAAKFVVDATEYVGRIPGLPSADTVIARASSWGGPASVCFVINQTGIELRDRERQSLAPEPLMLAAAAAAWNELADIEARATAHSAWLADFASDVQAIAGISVVNVGTSRAPHLLSLMLHEKPAELVASRLSAAGIYVGSGSACNFAGTEPSAVLAAMKTTTANSIRIGLPLAAAESDLDRLLEALPNALSD